MPWQSDGCPLTGKQGVEEERGHMLDQRLSTGERTGQAVEVFFIHTRAKIKEKIKTPILISLHKPPPLAAVQVIRMSFISISTHTNMCTCYSGVTGPWRYEYTHTQHSHHAHIHQHVTLYTYICVPFWTKHIVVTSELQRVSTF